MPKVSAAYKEGRRTLLLDSALFLFAEKGYDATTIDDVVKQAGVSKGAMYHYFKSKEEIYLELIDNGTRDFMLDVQAGFAKLETTTEKLCWLIHRAWETDKVPIRRNTLFILLEFWIYSSRHPELHDTIHNLIYRLRKVLMELVEEGKQRGEFRQDVDPLGVSNLFWAFRNGIAFNLFQLNDLDEQERSWQDLEQVLLKYLT